jgi:hypothetical protein
MFSFCALPDGKPDGGIVSTITGDLDRMRGWWALKE